MFGLQRVRRGVRGQCLLDQRPLYEHSGILLMLLQLGVPGEWPGLRRLQ